MIELLASAIVIQGNTNGVCLLHTLIYFLLQWRLHKQFIRQFRKRKSVTYQKHHSLMGTGIRSFFKNIPSRPRDLSYKHSEETLSFTKNKLMAHRYYFCLRETSPCLNHDQWQDKKGEAPESQLTKSIANSQILLKSILASNRYKRAEEQKSRTYKLTTKKFQAIAINLSIKQTLPSKDLSTRS